MTPRPPASSLQPRTQSPFVRLSTVLGVSLVLLSICGMGYADDFPLPKDVPGLDEPYEVTTGSEVIQAQGFSTSLSPERVRAFYEEALPTHGWRIEPLPWNVQIQERQGAFKQSVQEHQAEIEGDPELKAQVARMKIDELEELVRRQIYAARGTERLLLNLSPQDGETLVFINRWEESSPQGFFGSPDQPASQAELPAVPGAAQAGWPAVNSCCSGKSTPPSRRKLPSSIPQYPNARFIATGASAGGELGAGMYDASEISLSQDGVEQVVDYYRRHLAYSGWSPVEIPQGFDAQLDQFLGQQMAEFKTEMLAFRNDRGMCSIVVTRTLASSVSVPNGGLSISSAIPPATGVGGVADQADQPEVTVIMVSYLETPLMQEAWRGDFLSTLLQGGQR